MYAMSLYPNEQTSVSASVPEDEMRFTINLTAAITVIVFVLSIAMTLLTICTAEATPQMANGKRCNACYTGSPATKSNVKK